jgi:hypothetical protein
VKMLKKNYLVIPLDIEGITCILFSQDPWGKSARRDYGQSSPDERISANFGEGAGIP